MSSILKTIFEDKDLVIRLYDDGAISVEVGYPAIGYHHTCVLPDKALEMTAAVTSAVFPFSKRSA